MEKLFGVCGVLFRWHPNTLQVLLVIEKEDDDLLRKRQGMITIPMGRKGREETPEAATTREFQEETGLEVKIVCPIKGITEYPTTNGTIPFLAFVVRPKNEASTNPVRGELETCWMKVDDFLALPNEEVRPLVKEIVRLARLVPP